ncbi:MAG TPA: hypothetical protein VFG38_19770 [Pseudomonadales bacterium]|nr:hypothetical protein [Pseudomonadales bacterium]
MKMLRAPVAVLAVAIALSACQSNQQILAGSQAQAMQVAVNRGQFEMNCPQATGSVLSSEVVQPPINGPLVRGVERAEYTIGVAGCNQRRAYVVSCPQDGSNGCFAIEGQGNN